MFVVIYHLAPYDLWGWGQCIVGGDICVPGARSILPPSLRSDVTREGPRYGLVRVEIGAYRLACQIGSLRLAVETAKVETGAEARTNHRLIPDVRLLFDSLVKWSPIVSNLAGFIDRVLHCRISAGLHYLAPQCSVISYLRARVCLLSYLAIA